MGLLCFILPQTFSASTDTHRPVLNLLQKPNKNSSTFCLNSLYRDPGHHRKKVWNFRSRWWVEPEHGTVTVADLIAGLVNPGFIHIKQTYTLNLKLSFQMSAISCSWHSGSVTFFPGPSLNQWNLGPRKVIHCLQDGTSPLCVKLYD